MSMADGRGGVANNTSARTQSHVRLPLNTSRITAGQLRRLSTALGLTSSGSIDDLRLVIEGNITELGREPCNVQALFEEHRSDTAFTLVDDSGEFLTVSAVGVELPELLEDTEGNSDRENESSESELGSLRLSVTAITTERDTLLRELQTVKQDLEIKKARVKELWRMNCERLSEYDSLLVAKDEQIARLTAQLAERHHHRVPSEENDDADSVAEPQIRENRCGRAPPVDKFTGKDPLVRLDDWLPGLNRASRWNGWSPEEKWIQLAEHLRGRAEAEWNLLADEDICDFDTAVQNLKERLDPCSKVLAGQDFRRTVQGDNETVPNFICRLEKSFCVAFGQDGLSRETKEAMLFGQLQEGLRLGIIRSPNVSGALDYRGLCMAARHEEQRQAEIKKRQEYGKILNGNLGRSKDERNGERPSKQSSNGKNHSPGNVSSGSKMINKRCYVCDQPDHLAKNCKTNNREQESRGSTTQKKELNKSSTRQVMSESHENQHDTDEENSLDPLSLLYSDSEGTVDTVRVSDKGSRPQFRVFPPLV